MKAKVTETWGRKEIITKLQQLLSIYVNLGQRQNKCGDYSYRTNVMVTNPDGIEVI